MRLAFAMPYGLRTRERVARTSRGVAMSRQGSACAEMSPVAAAQATQLILATAHLSVDMLQHATYVPLAPRRDRLGQLAQPG